jgi:hypothetical protein
MAAEQARLPVAEPVKMTVSFKYNRLVYFYLAVTMILGTGLLGLFSASVVTAARAATMGCIVLACLHEAMKGNHVPLYATAALFLYGILTVFLFSSRYGGQFNANAGYFIYTFGGWTVLYPHLKRRPNELIKFAVWFSVAYLLVYVAIGHLYVLSHLGISFNLRGLATVGHDDDGSGRLYMSAFSATLVAAVGLERLLNRKRILSSALMLGLAGYCILFGDFRVYTAICLLVLGVYALLRLLSFEINRIALFTGLGTGAIMLAVAGLYVLNLNPYPFAFGGATAISRAIGFTVIRDYAPQNLFFGFGKPSGTYDWLNVVWYAGFADSDYGIYGLVMWGGLAAILLYAILMYLTFRSQSPLKQIGVKPDYAHALALTGWVLSAYAVSSPIYLFDGANLLIMIVIAANVIAAPARERRRLGRFIHGLFHPPETQAGPSKGLAATNRVRITP